MKKKLSLATWNHINAWNHIIVGKLLIFDWNTLNYITVWKQIIIIIK